MENLRNELKKIKGCLDKTEDIYIVNRTAYIEQNDNSLITIKDINIADCEITYTKRGEVLRITKNNTTFKPNFKIIGTELEKLTVDLKFLKTNKTLAKNFNYVFITNNEKLIITDTHILIAEEDIKDIRYTQYRFNAKFFRVLLDNKINTCTVTEKNELIIDFDNIKIEYRRNHGTNIRDILTQEYKTSFTLKRETVVIDDIYIDFSSKNFNEFCQIEFRLSNEYLELILKRFKNIKIETVEDFGFVVSPMRINDKVLLMPCRK